MSNQERDQLKKANPSKKWAEEVDKMRPDEVATIYSRLQAQGKAKK